MKRSRFLTIPVLLLLLGVARVLAADITGTWKASFETQIGPQNYTYQFVVKGTTLTGKIQSEMGGASEIQQGKVEGVKAVRSKRCSSRRERDSDYLHRPDHVGRRNQRKRRRSLSSRPRKSSRSA